MTKNIFTIPASLPFADTLARGIMEKYGHDPLSLVDITLLLPNRRSCRAVQEAFLRVTDGKPTLLPKMQPLGDVGDEDFAFKISLGGINAELPPVISGTRQRLLLARLIEKFQGGYIGKNKITTAQSASLAVELASFLDDVQRQQLSFDNLGKIVPEELAKHWQVTLDFMDIIIRLWPEILSERGATDAGTHRNIALNALSIYWQENPPLHPVIAAGSTGSIPATAQLLEVIAKMPNGAVILPGLDQIMDDAAWEFIEETHPQYGLKNLLDGMGVERNNVGEWSSSLRGAERSECDVAIHSSELSSHWIASSPSLRSTHRNDEKNHRSCLISQIMLPSKAAGQWQEMGGVPDDAVSGISKIEAASLQDEARIIALIFRDTLEIKAKTAALVTNDANLASRVMGIMARWGVELDNSSGIPLSEVTPCVFMRLVARMAEERMSPITMLACLKHPMACSGNTPGSIKNILRDIELEVLHGLCIPGGVPGLIQVLEERNKGKLAKWLGEIEIICKPFLHLMQQKSASFAAIVEAHITLSEKLAATDQLLGAENLWGNDSGTKLKEFFDELLEATQELPEIQPMQYSGILESLLSGKTYRPKYGSHPRLSILTPMEARMQDFDVVILGGMNEGSWPPMIEAGPWMSRPMRKNFGLPLPEKQIGQSAHDFAQVLHAPNVILTRSLKIDGTATIASRWLMRLDAVLGIYKKQDLLKPEKPWQEWALELDKTAYIPPQKPRPTPPAYARPMELPVTQVEKIMSNPYAHYADKILRLKKLDAINMEPGSRDFGDIIHKVIEAFVKNYAEIPANGRLGFLSDSWKNLLAVKHIPTAIQELWQPRFDNIASELIEQEILRRKDSRKIFAEVGGVYIITLEDGREFKITARADRLEYEQDGAITIVDYKTKSNISSIAKDMLNGTLPQMPLEALMADNSGFEGLHGKACEMEYWFITGGNDKEKAIKIEKTASKLLKNGGMENMLEITREGINLLVNSFIKESTPYLSCPDPENEPAFNDYAHLARDKEW